MNMFFFTFSKRRFLASHFQSAMNRCKAGNINHADNGCVKSVRIRNFSGPYFPEFGLKTKRYGVSLRIQSKYGKYGPEKLPVWTLFMQ